MRRYLRYAVLACSTRACLHSVRVALRVLILPFFLSTSLSGCLFENVTQIQVLGEAMGTTYSIVVVAPNDSVKKDLLKTQIDEELARLSKLMSTYDPESELSLFNQSDSIDWTPLSTETIRLIQTARRISKATGGAYDITLGSISTLFGFAGEPEEGEHTTPQLDDILELMNEIGYQLLLVSGTEINVRKLTPGLQVDLSSIGKGYAVDRIGEILEANGINRYLADIGGEIRTRGLAADGNMWKVGIELPQIGAQRAPSGVEVENAHIATSGDYRNYREVDGKRLSHLLDGRTGYPIDHNLASVTLLHGSVALADAWATAFMALGFVDSLKLAEERGIAVQFTVHEASGFKVHQTSSFAAFAYGTK